MNAFSTAVLLLLSDCHFLAQLPCPGEWGWWSTSEVTSSPPFVPPPSGSEGEDEDGTAGEPGSVEPAQRDLTLKRNFQQLQARDGTLTAPQQPQPQPQPPVKPPELPARPPPVPPQRVIGKSPLCPCWP